MNENEAEKQRTLLFELQAEAAAIESTGQAKAEAQVSKTPCRIIRELSDRLLQSF